MTDDIKNEENVAEEKPEGQADKKPAVKGKKKKIAGYVLLVLGALLFLASCCYTGYAVWHIYFLSVKKVGYNFTSKLVLGEIYFIFSAFFLITGGNLLLCALDNAVRARKFFVAVLGLLSVFAVWYLIYFFREWAFLGDPSLGIVGAVVLPPFWLSLFVLFMFFNKLVQYGNSSVFENIRSRKHFFRIYVCIWLAVLFGDHIVGYVYYKGLCITKAGGHIYKTVDLPEMPVWDKMNAPMHDAENGLYRDFLSNQPLIFGITQDSLFIKKKDILLSKWHGISFYGGWFIHALSLGSAKELGRCNGGKIFNEFDAIKVKGSAYEFEPYKNRMKGKKK